MLNIKHLNGGTINNSIIKWNGTHWIETSNLKIDDNIIIASSGIRISNTNENVTGNIRWDGSHFNGYNGTTWVNFDSSELNVNSGTTVNSTLRWSGTIWTENLNFTVNGTGDIYYSGNQREDYITLSAGTTIDVDWNLGNVFFIQITSNTTFTFSNLPGSGLTQEICMYIQQDGVGNRTVTVPGTVTWGDAGTPVWSSTASRYDVVVFRKLSGLTNVTGIFVGGGYS